jgi:hypothetical protein
MSSNASWREGRGRLTSGEYLMEDFHLEFDLARV